MKWKFLVLLGLFAGQSLSAAQAQNLVGDQAVADLRRWYADTRTNCGTEDKPSFLCTGVMLRATENNQAFLPWNPNPSSTGVSFSWLRSDTGFSGTVFDYRNGFIFYPKDVGAAGSGVINVLCVFPHDSDTSFRESNGCGKHRDGGVGSRPCDEQAIATGTQWIAHFNALAGWNKYIGQCGWSVRAGARSTAANVRAFIEGRSRMTAADWYTQNEVRLASWAQNAVVPLRAFFYLSGDISARDKAKNDQTRYKATFGVFAPVIRLAFPSSPTAAATFVYDKNEQALPDPGATPVPEVDPNQKVFNFDTMLEQSAINKIMFTNGAPFVEGASMSIARSVTQPGMHLQTSALLSISSPPGKSYQEIDVRVSRDAIDPRLEVTISCSEGSIQGAVFEDGYYAFSCASRGTFSKISFDNHSKIVRFDDVVFKP